MYHRNCPKNRTEYEPLRIKVSTALHYTDMTAYIRAWPNKLVSFVADRICDDDFRPFARELYEYICQQDEDGPPFEKWRE